MAEPTMEELESKLNRMEKDIVQTRAAVIRMKSVQPTKFEKIKKFATYEEWKMYVDQYAKNAYIFDLGGKISIQSGDRVLGEWDGEEGYFSESRPGIRLLEQLVTWNDKNITA